MITARIRHLSPLLLALAASAPAADLRNAPQESIWITDGAVNASALDGTTVYLGGEFTKVGRFTGGLTALATTNDATLGRPLSDSAWPVIDGEVFALISDGAGGWYMGGEFTRVGAHTTRNLAHISASGAVDTAFVSTNSSTWYGLALASGKLYAVDSYYYGASLRVISATTGGSISSLSLTGAPGSAHALTVAGTKLYIGHRGGVSRVETTTDTQDGFNIVTNNIVNAMVVDNGTLYVGGSFSTVGSVARKGLAAVSTTDGSLSTTWNPALSNNGEATSLLLSAGTLYVGGAFTTLGTAVQANLGRVTLATGLADSAWTPAVTGRVETIVLDATTLYVGGAVTSVGGTVTTGVGAVNTSTFASTGFAPVLADLGTNRTYGGSLVSALALGGGRLLVGGKQELGGGVIRNSAAALDLTTGQATTWNPDCSNGNAYTYDDAVKTLIVNNSNVILGGDFLQVGGVTHTRLAKVGTNGTIDSAFTAAADGTVRALAAASDGTLYIGGSFTTVASSSRNRLAALSSSGVIVSAFNPNLNSDVNSLLLDGTTLTLGGSFTQISTIARRGLAQVATADGALQTWNPNSAITVSPAVYCLAKQGNVLYLGGSFSKTSSFDRSNLAAVAYDTGAITAWDPGANSGVYALTISGTEVLVGGNFSTIGGATRNGHVGLVDAIGTTSTWNPTLTNSGYVRTTLALPDGRQLVGGDFRPDYLTTGSNSRSGFAVFGANTAPTANAGTLTVLEDATTTTVTATGSDGEGDVLTWRLGAVAPSKGTVTVASTGVCSYRPSANANGTDTFAVIANDGSLDSAPVLITVTITPVNDAPTAGSGSFSVLAGATYNGTLTGTDVDGNTLTYAVVTNPASGTLTVNSGTGAFSYTAPASGATSASFTYRVNDGTVDSAAASVSISITAITGFPTVSLTEPLTNAYYAKGSVVQLTAAAADSDGTVASVVFKQGTTTLATDTSAPWQTTVPMTTAGTFTFTAVATDNSGKSTTSAGVTVTVIDAPTVAITSPTNGATYPAPGSIDVTANATAGTPATVARIDFLLDNVLAATDATAPYQVSLPDVGAGAHVITARVIDNKGLTASTSVNIQVDGTVTPPPPTPNPNPDQNDTDGGGGGCGMGSGLAILLGALTFALNCVGRRQHGKM